MPLITSLLTPAARTPVPEPAPAPVAPKKKTKGAVAKAAETVENKAEEVVEKVKDAVAPTKEKASKTNGAKKAAGPPEVGSIISASDLETFGGEIETNDGEKTTLKKMLEETKTRADPKAHMSPT